MRQTVQVVCESILDDQDGKGWWSLAIQPWGRTTAMLHTAAARENPVAPDYRQPGHAFLIRILDDENNSWKTIEHEFPAYRCS